MNRTSKAPLLGDLVPIAERMRLIQALRVGIAACAALVVWRMSDDRQTTSSIFATVTAAYLGLGFAGLLAWRLSRRIGITIFGLVLLVDSAYLCWVTYATGGSGSPIRYLIVLQVMAVALLASYRTGVKVAAWNSLLLLVVYYLRQGDLLRPLDRGDIAVGTPLEQLVGFTAVLWIAALATSHFSAVNERELRRRRYDIEALAAMAEQLERTPGSAAAAQVLLECAADAFALDRGVVLAGPEGGDLRVLAARGVVVDATFVLTPRAGTVVHDAMTGRATRLAGGLDGSTDPLSSLLPDARSLVVVPLTGDGHSIGVLAVERPVQGSRIERRVVSMLERFAAYGSLALRNAWLLEQVQVMAATDPLTGLANRTALHDRLAGELARARRAATELTLVMIDVDHFKRVNDTYGHQVGDAVLRRIARQLTAECREGELVSRYGGEEFFMVLPGASDLDGQVAAERVRRIIGGGDGEPHVSVSLGVAAFPVDAEDVDSLIDAADRALYASKDAGRDRVTRARSLSPQQAARQAP